jgi:hypothetical protein
VNLVSLLVLAPLGGVQKRDPKTVHAITMEAGMDALLSGRLAVAACGKKHLRFVSTADGGKVLVWPIRAKGELTRCRECWVATGSKRPRRAS